MSAWIITVLVCAHGHALCHRKFDTGYFLKRTDCEYVLKYLPEARQPRCVTRPLHKLIAHGYAPIGKVPSD